MDTLMRSRTNRRIAGICGGLAQQYGWNVTAIRLLWVALVLFAGTGVLAYLILWVVLPEEPLVLPRSAAAPVYPSTQPYYPGSSQGYAASQVASPPTGDGSAQQG